MNLKQRIAQLENQLGNRRGAIIVVHSKNGIVTKGKFSGLRLTDLEKQFASNDVLINVVRSQAEIKNGDTIT